MHSTVYSKTMHFSQSMLFQSDFTMNSALQTPSEQAKVVATV